MGGDVVSATTQYYYQQAATNTSGSTLVADVLGSLVQAIAGSPVTSLSAKGATSGISSQLDNTVSFKSLVAPDAADAASTLPKAYLTVLFFDERFNFVGESSTTMRVGGVPGPNASLTAANLKAPKNGYAYVYVSNESQEPVYFDNLQVAHTRGRIAEETHYYSYGLQIAAISSKKVGDSREGTLDNRYGYNDKELWDDADLNWLNYGFRNYDPQIGRFPQLDPLTFYYPHYTPYQFAGCEPIANVDVDGLEPANAIFTGVKMMSGGAAVVSRASDMAPLVLKAVKHTAKATSSTTKIIGAVKAVASTLVTLAEVGTEMAVNSAGRLVEQGAQNLGGFLRGFGAFAGHAVGTVFGVLSPLQAGPKPVAIPGYKIVGDRAIAVDANGNPKYGPAPNPQPGSGGDDDGITLYRGVHAEHPGLEDAKKGIARPHGGNASPEQHNGANYKSNFTSWSYSRGVAQHHANKEGPGGIILTRKFRKSQLVHSPDAYMELEVLIRGVVTGATPEVAKPGGTPSAF